MIRAISPEALVSDIRRAGWVGRVQEVGWGALGCMPEHTHTLKNVQTHTHTHTHRLPSPHAKTDLGKCVLNYPWRGQRTHTYTHAYTHTHIHYNGAHYVGVVIFL